MNSISGAFDFAANNAAWDFNIEDFQTVTNNNIQSSSYSNNGPISGRRCEDFPIENFLHCAIPSRLVQDEAELFLKSSESLCMTRSENRESRGSLGVESSSQEQPNAVRGGRVLEQTIQKERNRVAAKKSRDNAKQRMLEMEKRLEKVAKENATLQDFILKNFVVFK
mmetsp:Transcript_3794/g.9897  ORF Transcript_3794/g.9897 Transcript_3794/m.9897 type:complete len:167 (+) Transcript_3794:113-613(+)|eukprot:CAMPEP_0184731658 /NCGR_PEP_ID=MMETSP0314-20130426/51554_1 /TAXON_ID=38298 /ORGANISM="Rhodella maculata, Strain CCMP 736" /LENGTH=166 /DNA_ID=CAMNT_0027198083 /DNA_START=40 /DNA_END=540 /DNA_ORIENTATION=+